MAAVNHRRRAHGSRSARGTLMHEHLMIRSPGVAENWPELYDHRAAVETTAARLRQLTDRGIQTVVDLTTPDCGRDAKFYADLQAEVEINIIACTGLCWTVPVYWWFSTVEEMAAVFVRDIDEGIQNTPIKPGILKVATDALVPQPPTMPDHAAWLWPEEASSNSRCVASNRVVSDELLTQGMRSRHNRLGNLAPVPDETMVEYRHG